MDRVPEVRATLEGTGADLSELAFVATDLTAADGWPEGTLRVLRAAADAAVRRVVVTSSFAAIERGELAADTDPDALIELLVAPTYVRLLLDRPLDTELLRVSVRRTLRAFGATHQSRSRRSSRS